MQELIDEPLYAVEPLYAAAYRGDIDAIKKLSKLKVDPNAQHTDSGYTALHVAVFKFKLDSVIALLTEFKDTLLLGESCLFLSFLVFSCLFLSKMCLFLSFLVFSCLVFSCLLLSLSYKIDVSMLFISINQSIHTFIDSDLIFLDVADRKGDTALHIASRLDISDIVAVICDSPHCDPLSRANKMGQYPTDVARSHQTYQFIKVCQERNKLAKELKALKSMQAM